MHCEQPKIPSYTLCIYLTLIVMQHMQFRCGVSLQRVCAEHQSHMLINPQCSSGLGSRHWPKKCTVLCLPWHASCQIFFFSKLGSAVSFFDSPFRSMLDERSRTRNMYGEPLPAISLQLVAMDTHIAVDKHGLYSTCRTACGMCRDSSGRKSLAVAQCLSIMTASAFSRRVTQVLSLDFTNGISPIIAFSGTTVWNQRAAC